MENKTCLIPRSLIIFASGVVLWTDSHTRQHGDVTDVHSNMFRYFTVKLQ